MEFAKLHGLGNDFLLARAREGGPPTPLSELARRICDRRRGVGADGIVFYQPTVGDRDADFSALIFNADGSRAEMSGNGVRCLAAFLDRSAQHRPGSVRVRTVSGIKTLALQKREGNVYTFESDMGIPVVDPRRIPWRAAAGPEPVLNRPLQVGGRTVAVSLCSMGNPHCSTFWQDASSAPVDTLGPLLENHDSFPNRTNVEFIQVMDFHRIRVRFWERGVGRTLASGTGSCAAAVAAILNGLAASPVTVETELGSMSVRWETGCELFLTGPAEFICSGSYAEPEDPESR